MSGEKVIKFQSAEEKERDESTLEVFNVKYIDREFTNKEELFQGYSHLRAITFSYNLGFISEILQYFNSAEIIIGCSWRAKYDLQEIMAFQQESLQAIRRNKYLVERIDKGEVTFWHSDVFLVHSKIYILSDDTDTKTRVITGSANFTRVALSGAQREHIEKFDNDQNAYLDFVDEFEATKMFCCQEVIREAIIIKSNTDPDDPHTIPIIREAMVKEGGVILNPVTNKEEIQYVTELARLERKYESVVPKLEKKNGKILLRLQKVNELLRKYATDKAEREKKTAVYPVFHLNLKNQSVTLNGDSIDLTPDQKDIQNDLNCIREYFDNFSGFIGDSFADQKVYFKIMNYMFLSVFISEFRYNAKISGESTRYFPMYAIIIGKKSAGKSSFVETMQKLMYGKEICSYSADQFTSSKVRNLLMTAEGVVAHFDDLDKRRYDNHAMEIMKDESYLIDNYRNHPTIIITTNNIVSLKKPIAKRVYYAKISITQDDMSAAAKHRKMMALRKQMTTAFYREYLRRMIDLANEAIHQMYETDPVVSDWHADLFNISSRTILSIFADNDIEIPEYFSEVAYEDYFGDNNDAKTEIKKKLIFEWQHNKKAFKVNKKKNELRYTAGENWYDAERICEALPDIFEPVRVGNDVLMNLDEAEKFFGFKFRNGFLGITNN